MPLVQCITDSCGSSAVCMCVGELESAGRIWQERINMCDSEKVGAGGVAHHRRWVLGVWLTTEVCPWSTLLSRTN